MELHRSAGAAPVLRGAARLDDEDLLGRLCAVRRYHIEELAAHTLEMFPCLGQVNVLRQWSGLCDMTPDYAPIMGTVEGLDGFVLSCGWGSWGFKAAPAAGKRIAELISTGETPDLIKPFALSRFRTGRLVNERAAAPAAAVH